MVLILVAIVVLAALSVFLVKYGDNQCNAFVLLVGLCGCVCVVITSCAYAFTVWSWIASEHRTNIINREYGTQYTREEVFYASDVIDTVRQLERQRIEVNGNLLSNTAVVKK